MQHICRRMFNTNNTDLILIIILLTQKCDCRERGESSLEAKIIKNSLENRKTELYRHYLAERLRTTWAGLTFGSAIQSNLFLKKNEQCVILFSSLKYKAWNRISLTGSDLLEPNVM